ncbi:MAG: hypothetical protein PUH48_09315 [Prevotella sp.]|nr:hypothetical protein [Prevotella sp.]MDD7226264.1 hypothetical protein [Prevotella sp.]
MINTLLLTLPPWASPQAAGRTNHYGALKAKVMAFTSHIFVVTTQVGLSYSPMHNFPRCNQRE